MRKYLPGGRCGGYSTEMKKEDTQGTNASFNALLAQRDAQMAQLFQPQSQQPPLTQPQTQIIVVEQKKQPSKDQLIQTILDGDY